MNRILRRSAIALAIVAAIGATLVVADREQRKHALISEQQRLQEIVSDNPTAEELSRRLGRPPTQDVPAKEIERLASAFASMRHRVEEMRTKAGSAERVLLYASHQWVYIFFLDKKSAVRDFICFAQ
jgi:hypothetical protein